MDFMVTAADGKDYGPVTLDQLREWVQDNRVGPATSVRNFHTGQTTAASAIPGLFGPVAPPPPGATDWSQPPSPYPRQYQSMPAASTDDGKGVLIGVLLRSGAGVAFFFFLHGIGLIFCGYSLYYAIVSMTRGHKYGPISLGIAAVAFVAVLIGWILRVSSGGSV